MHGEDEQPARTAGALGLPVEAGLCGACRHASVKSTNRDTTYLRCTQSDTGSRGYLASRSSHADRVQRR
jgi:hypothetical protein